MHTLISTSQLQHSPSTLEMGRLVALAIGSDVSLLTIRTPQNGPSATSTEINNESPLMSDPSIQHIIRDGAVETEIVAEISTGKYDLLVIGAREHRSTPEELLLGDLPQRMLKQTPISTLIVRGQARKLQNILICTAGQEPAVSTVTVGAKLAKSTNSRVTMLHVAADVPSMYTGLGQMGETLPDLLQTQTPIARHLRACAKVMKSHQVEAQLELRHGTPVKEILRSIELGSFDLLIIGASGRHGLHRVFLDEVTEKLAALSTLPVMVTRPSLGPAIT